MIARKERAWHDGIAAPLGKVEKVAGLVVAVDDIDLAPLVTDFVFAECEFGRVHVDRVDALRAEPLRERAKLAGAIARILGVGEGNRPTRPADGLQMILQFAQK